LKRWQRLREWFSAFELAHLRTLFAQRKVRIGAAVTAGILIAALVLIAAFPIGLLRGLAEDRLAETFGAPVEIAELSRIDSFSFMPEVRARGIRIAQPAWAGKGDFLKIAELRTKVSVFSLLSGDVSPQSIDIVGLNVALVRDAKGNSNWGGRADKPKERGRPLQLSALTIRDSRFSLRDAKRRLDISGSLASDDLAGLRLSATGTFNGAPARAEARGGRIAGAAGRITAWPFTASLASRPLDIDVKGTMAGILDADDLKMTMRARGTSLKQLDHIIEAGLFGTQDIDLSGDVRRDGEDWYIDRLNGSIGRSRLQARATVLKREGRTKIDATIRAPQLDFDDLADDAGLAQARAEEARIGKRVIPSTRIDLSRMGPTDGIIRFTIDRLLIEGGSAFQSLKGELTLDHRVLKLQKAVAGLDQGRMTGWVKVDSTKPMPIFSTELRVEGSSLDTLIGAPDMIGGPLRGLVRITGSGATIREAFANGSGKIVFASSSGSMDRAAAFVLGQNLGGAIGEKLGGGDNKVSINCALFAFDARDGVLTPSPLLLDTAVSSGRGRGKINLDGETIALTITGAAKGDPLLKLVDPLSVGGTLSAPAIAIDGKAQQGTKPGGGIFRSLGRSIGSALGLRKDKEKPGGLPASVSNCDALAARALR
jgi:uncharacterized protein involved in outer membrane biogenesis